MNAFDQIQKEAYENIWMHIFYRQKGQLNIIQYGLLRCDSMWSIYHSLHRHILGESL